MKMENVCLSFQMVGGFITWRERAFRIDNQQQKKNRTEEEIIEAITEFFLTASVFQLRNPGITPVNVFNRDQVPMALTASFAATIDEK